MSSVAAAATAAKAIGKPKTFKNYLVKPFLANFAPEPPPPTPRPFRGNRVVDLEKLSRLAKEVKNLNPSEFDMFQTHFKGSLGLQAVDKFMVDLTEKASKIDVSKIVMVEAAPTAAVDAEVAAAAAPVVATKVIFDVKLESFAAGDKIKVIKLVRELLKLGLKETKEMVEGIPVVLMKDLPQKDAEEWLEKFKAVGATCKLE